jgi:hypothetical protein
MCGSSDDACLIEQIKVLYPAPRTGKAVNHPERAFFDKALAFQSKL